MAKKRDKLEELRTARYFIWLITGAMKFAASTQLYEQTIDLLNKLDAELDCAEAEAAEKVGGEDGSHVATGIGHATAPDAAQAG